MHPRQRRFAAWERPSVALFVAVGKPAPNEDLRKRPRGAKGPIAQTFAARYRTEMVQLKPHPPLAFVNARLIDPESGAETRGGVLVEEGRIRDFGAAITAQNLPREIALID